MRPSWSTGSGWDALPECREWSNLNVLNNSVTSAFLSTSSVSTSTFRVSVGPSVNFPYVRGTFYQLS